MSHILYIQINFLKKSKKSSEKNVSGKAVNDAVIAKLCKIYAQSDEKKNDIKSTYGYLDFMKKVTKWEHVN